jgi:cation:H+ antiporter
VSSLPPLLLSFAIVLSGALLFTNAIEWLGDKLELGQGAVGSLLAAVATALPESLIPVVALVGGADEADDVTTGAILGAPFMLATIAMALVGVSAFLYRARRPQGLRLDVHAPTLARDLAFFVSCFSAGLVIGVVGAPHPARVAAALLLVLAYAGYVQRTLTKGGDVQAQETIKPLIFDVSRGDPPRAGTVIAQLGVALGAIVGGAHLLVEELVDVAAAAGVEPLVLALVLTPFATELPEKVNSLFWVREAKDSLALGNVTGAMVFQTTVPVAFGLAFTSWELDRYSIVAGALAIAGGILAILTLQIRRRFNAPAIVGWAGLYAAFVVYVVASV